MSHEHWMRLAIDTATEGIALGQTPFGACIVKDDRLIAAAHNTVWASLDSTAHAEINAIRAACAALRSIDLAGCTIYSTCEPCPMCFAACHWAKISTIVYGASIADARRTGFSELTIANAEMKRIGNSPMRIIAGVSVPECRRLFDEWLARPDRRSY
jgi:tRNA(Arg) A34 adenosine deaminase TadA